MNCRIQRLVWLLIAAALLCACAGPAPVISLEDGDSTSAESQPWRRIADTIRGEVATHAAVTAVAGVLAEGVREAHAGADSHAPQRFTFCVQPLGEFDDLLVELAAEGVALVYGMSTGVLDPAPMPEDAWYLPRRRWRADRILDWLEADVLIAEPGCDFVMALTGEDISATVREHEDWGIFGLGARPGQVAITSSHRLDAHDADAVLIALRTMKVVNHELGHNLGIPHVPDRSCLMTDAEGTIDSVDETGGWPCLSTRDVIEERNRLVLPPEREGALAALAERARE